MLHVYAEAATCPTHQVQHASKQSVRTATHHRIACNELVVQIIFHLSATLRSLLAGEDQAASELLHLSAHVRVNYMQRSSTLYTQIGNNTWRNYDLC